MDKIQQDYKEAYKKANGEDILIRRLNIVRYIIKGDTHQFTAKQIKEFTKTLSERE